HWARFCQGIALTRSDDLGKAIETMRDAMNASEKINAVFLQPLHLAHLASAYMSIGQPQVALGLLDQATATVRESEERLFAAALHRLKGEAILQIGGDGEAELQRTQTISHGQAARLWELRASVSLARLRRDQGCRGEAHDLLAPVYGWFTEGLDTPDL